MVNHRNSPTNNNFDYKDVESNESEFIEDPSSSEQWFVYICESRVQHFYVGISKNPQQRLGRHNNGLGSKMARDQGGFTIVYISSPFATKSEARTREIQVKKWSRAKKLKLISGEWI